MLSVADGISRVHGLDNCMSMEPGAAARRDRPVLNLESDNVGAVSASGTRSRRATGSSAPAACSRSPWGGAAGRIVDPLGNPLDGKGDVDTDQTYLAEFQGAPGVVQRQPVKEPMLTGIKAIDSMTNVGCGQRELIIGDRQTGKSSICLDTIINKDSDVVCIYVAIGQRMSTVADVAAQLDDAGALRAHDHRRRPRRRGGADQVPGAVRGLRDGRALPLQRLARACSATT